MPNKLSKRPERGKLRVLTSQNIRLARKCWDVRSEHIRVLRALTEHLGLSVALGDVRLQEGQWYVTHSGLLRAAFRKRCSGMKTVVSRSLSRPDLGRWVVRATVYKSPRSRGFSGWGDADPTNVSPLVRGSELRMAETRAINRALRKAYGLGLCSVEELGSVSSLPQGPRTTAAPVSHANGNSSGRSEPKLRDRLCLLIRQHNLDPSLVKAYAADFCGTASLKEASRDRIEAFIAHLASEAKDDRDALVCKLNSYAHPVKVKS